MFQRFRKKHMILDDIPSTPADDTVYPEQMSAEYLQAIQENTEFNHLGYEDKPKEAFGVVTLILQRSVDDLEGPVTEPTLGDPAFVDNGDGRIWGGERSVRVNFDGTLSETDGTAIAPNSAIGTFLGSFSTAPSVTTGRVETYFNTTNGKYYRHSSTQNTWNLYESWGEYHDKYDGVESFSADDSYTVMLTIDQFIGVDFNAPSTGSGVVNPAQIQPLLNPNYEAHSFIPVGGTLQTLATNRHDRPLASYLQDRITRPSYINMSAYNKETDYFELHVSRNSVWAQVQTVSSRIVANRGTSIVVVHDYQRTSRTEEYVIYSPATDPDPPPAADPPVTFNLSGVTSYPRNYIRIAWYAKGV